jgi:hypothetical protein
MSIRDRIMPAEGLIAAEQRAGEPSKTAAHLGAGK